MACVTLAREYDTDFSTPAVSSPFAPCRRLDLDTTAAKARETSAVNGAPPLTSPLPAAPPAREKGEGCIGLFLVRDFGRSNIPQSSLRRLNTGLKNRAAGNSDAKQLKAKINNVSTR